MRGHSLACHPSVGSEETLPVDSGPPRRDDDDAPVVEGSTIGRYTILSKIGGGTSGAVFAAYDPRLDRRIALKRLHRRARNPETAEALLGEARALAKLSDPHVITVHDAGLHQERVFVAMEYVDGPTLAQWASRLELPPMQRWQRVLRVLVGAGWGLAAAHRAGLVHRDVKPQNVLVAEGERAVVVDFGLALAAIDPTTGVPLPGERSRRWKVVGTPAYMAPELLDGVAPDPRADQFGFCVTAFEALWNKRPFVGESPYALANAAAEREIQPVDDRSVPGWVKAAILRGLHADPRERWPGMRPLLEALDRDRRRRRRTVVLSVTGGLALLATGSVFGAASQQAPREPPDACDRGPVRMEGVWDAAVRTTIKERFIGLRRQQGDGEAAFATVAGALDDYTRRWLDAYRDACEAGRDAGASPDGLPDRRTLCLDRALLEVESFTQTLRQADSAAVTQALAGAYPFRALERCDDAEELRTSPLPRDEQEAAALHDVERLITQGRALHFVGRFDEALALLDDAVDQTAGGFPQTEVHARHARARVLHELNRFGEAERELEVALARAASHDLDRDQIALWFTLSEVVGQAQARHLEALFYARQARALLERFPDLQLEVRLLRHLGILHTVQGRLSIAGEHFDQALSVAPLPSVAGEHRRASLLNGAGMVQESLGRPREALARYDEAYEIRRRLYGTERNTRVAGVLNNRGSALRRLGRFDESAQAHTRALEIRRALRPPDHTELGHVRLNLARLERARGRPEAALEHGEAALTIYRDALGEEHYLALEAMVEIARSSALAGRPDQARATLDAVIRLGTRDRLSQRVALAQASLDLARLALEAGQIAQAERWLEAAPAVENQPLRAWTAMERARVAIAQHQPDRAQVELDDAMRFWAESPRFSAPEAHERLADLRAAIPPSTP